MSTSHTARIPAAAAAYFTSLGVAEHPVIRQSFTPGPQGWRPYPWRKRVSLSVLRQERAAGRTHVALAAGGHSADFSITELLRRSR